MAISDKNIDRIGTTLAFVTQVCLVASVHFAYVQYLWKDLKRKVISVCAIDAGFNACNSLLPFANMEMIYKLRVASFLAMVTWYVLSALLHFHE